MRNEKSKKLYNAITKVREEIIDEAQKTKLRKPVCIRRWTGIIAATVVLAVGLGSFGLWHWIQNNMRASSGGFGHDEGTEFMSYGGPVFPLTLKGNAVGIESERSLTYDFLKRPSENDALGVTDSYALTNAADEDKAVTLIYPFNDSYAGFKRPVLSINGNDVDTQLYAGPYSGGFEGAWGGGPSEATLNLDTISSWEGYKALLNGGRYMKQAFADFPELNQQVVVYEFSDPKADHEAAENPTLAVSFNLDYEKATVLSYGFDGGSYDREGGYMRQSFSIPQEGEFHYGRHYYLLILGDDINDYTIQGYEDGGCDKGEEMDATVTVRRYESSLGEMVQMLLRCSIEEYGGVYIGDFEDNGIPFEMFYGSVAELLYQYGMLSESVVDRYDTGWLEDIFSEVRVHDRVFYLSAETTIPAGEVVTVTVELRKDPSFDFYCSAPENRGILGYDLVTRLGTNLTFSSLTAELINTDGVEIIRQNYGFDLAKGVTKVDLDPEIERYFLEVRRTSEDR
jgi:hypothetical protein